MNSDEEVFRGTCYSGSVIMRRLCASIRMASSAGSHQANSSGKASLITRCSVTRSCQVGRTVAWEVANLSPIPGLGFQPSRTGVVDDLVLDTAARPEPGARK